MNIADSDALLITTEIPGVYKIVCGRVLEARELKEASDKTMYADDIVYIPIKTPGFELKVEYSRYDPDIWKKLGWKLIRANWTIRWNRFKRKHGFFKSEYEEEW
jgi:hypothetical protein